MVAVTFYVFFMYFFCFSSLCVDSPWYFVKGLFGGHMLVSLYFPGVLSSLPLPSYLVVLQLQPDSCFHISSYVCICTFSVKNNTVVLLPLYFKKPVMSGFFETVFASFSDSDLPYPVTECQCCQSSFLARVILGGLPLPSQSWFRVGNGAGDSSPTLLKAHRGVFNVHQLMAADATPSLTSIQGLAHTHSDESPCL